MLTFLDGPASPGANGLLIRRTPVFLRVTRDGKGVWDALDQVNDFARPGETLYAYRLVETRGHVHIRRQRGGGCFAIATYRFIDPQPNDATLRSNMAWRAWCLEKQKETSP